MRGDGVVEDHVRRRCRVIGMIRAATSMRLEATVIAFLSASFK